MSKRDFERKMLPHLAASYNLAVWLLRNSHDAEDVVQEAYLRAFTSWGNFEDRNARAWMLKIVYNCCHSFLLRSARNHRNVIRLEAAIAGDPQIGSGLGMGQMPVQPETELIHSAERRALYLAVMRLPQDYREVIVLREYEDLSYQEIADVVDIPIGTVMSRLSRARKRLAAVLAAKHAGGHEHELP